MERGKVDAAMMGEPSISLLEKRAGSLRILVDTRSKDGLRQALGVDHYPAAVLYSTEDWLRKNSASAASLSHALEKTLRYLQSSPQEAATKMPGEFQGDDPALYAQVVQHALAMYSPDGRMPDDGPGIVKKVLSTTLEKVRESKLDLNASFTNQFLQH
jgi:NitT/TauT family transport system substrate-binding protein